MRKRFIIYLFLIIFSLLPITSLADEEGIVPPENVIIIKTPEQTEVGTPPEFQYKVIVPPTPEGKNLALKKPIEANGYTQIYMPRYANDGRITSYWEGKPNSYPNIITVDLGSICTIHTIRIALNPAKIWVRRTQTLAVYISNDGVNYIELLPYSDYVFDPRMSNIVDIKLPNPIKTRYVRLIFIKNTGATGGQIGELEIYGEEEQ